ncbi:DUF2339 domain-containing protein [Metabacillus fastidiosus]|uniref:DUF2339 domain-containing protein n=1 Tax=Metabacillus fastidiosus TaxID=1458 RepID=UPI002E1F87A4|nr:DUF2339 domain-containing protein [Metabacillus fastidiosus]
MEEKRDRIEELEKRVDELRKEAYELKSIILELKREAPSKQANVEEVKAKEENQLLPPTPIKEPQPVDWEKRIGQVWLPRIFIFVLLLGIIWAFKAASDYGLMQPPLKIAFGFIAAVVLIFLGHNQIVKSRNALGQVLLGGSVILLFIDTFAMHILYGMIPGIIAFILNVLWISLGIYFAYRYKSEPLAILTSIGGYLIPFLLENHDPNIVNFVIFETIFYCIMLLFAWKRKFVYLYTVTFALLHITLLAGSFLSGAGDIRIFGLAVIIQHILLLVTFFKEHSFIKVQMTVLFTSFILTVCWIGSTFQENQYELIVLFSFLLYSYLSVYFWKKNQERLTAALSISTVALVIFLLSKFDTENIQGLLMIQGLITAYLAMKAKTKFSFIIGIVIYTISALLTFGGMFHSIFSIEFINWLILLISLWVLTKLLSLAEQLKESDKETLRKTIFITFLIVFLIFVSLFVGVLTTDLSLNIQYMTVSFSWAVYALAAIMLGVTKENKILRVFGLILLFVTLAKLILIDLIATSIFIRAILFIGLGIIGVVGSRIFYVKKEK